MSRLKTITNGPKIETLFSPRELDSRVAKLRKFMSEQGLDAIVLTSVQNINYYCEFLYCGFGRKYALVIDHNKITTLTANIDGGQPYRKGQLAPTQLVGIGNQSSALRMIKSPEEIKLIKEGARIANIGARACIAAVKEGVKEYEVALAGTTAMYDEISKTYPNSELRDTWVWFQSGLNTDGAHNPNTSRQIQKGDILSLNCFPMINGYYTALERTLFFDSVTPEQLKLWEINCEVYEAGLKLIKPGVKCSEIALVLNKIFEKHNVLEHRSFGYGHSFGCLSHYYGREPQLELREDNHTVLEPGMVVSIEPMIMINGEGYREHDILVVTEYGCENITNFPVGPDHLILQDNLKRKREKID